VIVVRHPNLRDIMAFERADVAGTWQLPQGGLSKVRNRSLPRGES
jgi:hypothetical protein